MGVKEKEMSWDFG